MTITLNQNDPLLSSSEVRHLCGNISKMTLWRWRESLDFPEPLTLNSRNYWQLSEITNWLETAQKK